MTLLLQPRIRRCNRRSRRSVGQRTTESTPPSFAAPSARFAGVCAVSRRTFMKTPGLPFTGIDDPYEEPFNPEVVVSTDRETVDESAGKVIRKLDELGWLLFAKDDA